MLVDLPLVRLKLGLVKVIVTDYPGHHNDGDDGDSDSKPDLQDQKRWATVLARLWGSPQRFPPDQFIVRCCFVMFCMRE